MVAAPLPLAGASSSADRAAGFLSDAAARLDAGDHVGAGVRIRHAALLLLTSLAQHVGIRRPLRHLFPRPARIARALYRAKQIDLATLEALLDVLARCNAAAHFDGDVCASSLRQGIELLRSLIHGGQQ